MEAIFSILIGVGLGYWADSYFETEPRYLIVGSLLGFAAFVLRLFRMVELVKREGEQAAAAEASETSPQRSVACQTTDTNGILGGTDRRLSDDSNRGDEAGEKDR